MLIRMGLGGQLSGSVGGVTASRNRFGQYLRNRSVPVNPQSVRQNASRTAFASATVLWAGLTAAQRDAWNGYAAGTPVLNRLGESVNLNGFQMYVRSAAFSIQMNASPSAIAPATPGLAVLGAPVSITLGVAAGVTLATLDSDVTRALVAIGPALSPGSAYAGGPVTLFGQGTPLTATGGVIPGNQAVNRYGLPVVGERRVVRIRGGSADEKLAAEFRQIVTVVA